MRESTDPWQKILAQGFRSAKELLAYLHLPTDLASTQAEQLFKTQVPRGFAQRMSKANPLDPLLLQVLAQAEETLIAPGYVLDPLEEVAANPIPGLIHKYQNRVLLVVTGICAINCRFCFRRHFPYADNNPGLGGWKQALDYIAGQSDIQEVILSGGDPLLASDATLTSLLAALAAIPHVNSIRVHSRIPVVLPERIDAAFLSLFDAQRFKLIMVLHANHSQELDDSVSRACKQLKASGWTLLNQSVILKGVNDQAAILADLSRRLFDDGILPYYLHMPDKVAGTQHFDLSRAQILTIYAELKKYLPGYLLPRLVCEEPGLLHKTLLA